MGRRIGFLSKRLSIGVLNTIKPSSMTQWYALYTKPRAEKKAAERLARKGFETYCPTYTTLKQWSDRKKKVTMPIIPSYIFIKIEEKQRYEVLQDHGVMNFVYWLGKPAIVKEEEIERLQGYLTKQQLKSCETIQLKAGDMAKLATGGMKGLEGLVQKVNTHRVYILIEGLGIVVSCEPAGVELI